MDFEILLIAKDDTRPIHNCDFLCEKAILEQRRFDVFKIGKYLGIKKLSNLMLDADDINIEILTAKLQLLFMISGVKVVYCQNVELLTDIVREISKITNTTLYLYNCDTVNVTVFLDQNEIKTKCNALKMITGHNSPNERFVKPIDSEGFCEC